MKKRFFYAVALFTATMIAGCSESAKPTGSDTGNDDGSGDEVEVEIISGELTEDYTLKANTTYSLDGAYVVKAGATLKIEEGVEIVAVDDEVDDYILIEQGAKIDAQGTDTSPIVMTSEKKKSGAWGGIHICGYASTNITNGISEIGKSPYGGDKDDDNSGILKYIRLEYTGFKLNEEQESNGISFYGVGNGTTVSHIQAYRGADDGFEFFGGTVNVKNMVATSCKDDSFDWTEGWRGKGQFMIAYQENENDLGYPCDCLIEADNNGDNAGASPMSHPILSNLTLVGNNSVEDTDGVMLKASTEVEIYNAIITGKKYPIVTKTAHTEEALKGDISKLDGITMTGELNSKEGNYTNADFAANTNNSTMFVNTLVYNYYGIKAGGVVANDSFFEAVDYQGALDPKDDWTAGWVKNGEEEEITVSKLSGEIIADLTIPANSKIALDGAFIVRKGATLTIKEGVEIEAIDDDIDDYILIEQGAKIDAQGTAAKPIVMTSESKKSGAWGGIHICGYAKTNIGNGISEIGKSPYGGDNDADNSGILKYIRLEYTGFKLNEEQESNGISFYGVGNGTSVSYIQAYRGADDGFEFFGGSVDVKYMIATSSKDDSFDWTEGWRGRGQYLIANQEDESVINYPCDCLIEADNNGDNAAASPMSHPVLSNLTLVGNNGSEDTDGVMLKASTEVEIYNAIITGKKYPIVTKTTHTEEALKDGSSILNYITMGGELKSNESIYSNALFSAATGNSTDYTNGLTDVVYGIVEGGAAPSDDFFDATDYKGAISKDNDWAAGWAIL